MMQVTIVGFSSELHVNPSKNNATLTLSLPNGQELKVPVPMERAQEISMLLYEAYASSQRTEQDIQHAEHREYVDAQDTFRAEDSFIEEEVPPEQTPRIGAEAQLVWMDIEENLLPLYVKYAMVDLNLPDILLPTQIEQIRDQILTDYTEADWARLVAKAGVEAAPPAATPTPQVIRQPARVPLPPAAPLGLEWSANALMRPSVPSRTVPSDEKGYPIVPPASNAVSAGTSTPDDDGVEAF